MGQVQKRGNERNLNVLHSESVAAYRENSGGGRAKVLGLTSILKEICVHEKYLRVFIVYTCFSYEKGLHVIESHTKSDFLIEKVCM